MCKRMKLILIVIVMILNPLLAFDENVEPVYKRWITDEQKIVRLQVPTDGFFADTMEVYDSIIIDTKKSQQMLANIKKNDTMQISNKELLELVEIKLYNDYDNPKIYNYCIYFNNLKKIGLEIDTFYFPYNRLIFDINNPDSAGLCDITTFYIDKDKSIYIVCDRLISPYIGEFVLIKFNRYGKCILKLDLKSGAEMYYEINRFFYVDYIGNIYQRYGYYDKKQKKGYDELIKYFRMK